MNFPNLLTIGRIFLTPLVCIAIYYKNLPWAFSLLLVACLSDFADGYIAHKTHSQSALGAALDPLADKILVFLSVFFLAQGGVLSSGDMWAWALMLSRELVVMALRGVVNFKNVPVSIAAKGKTACQMLGLLILVCPYELLPLWVNPSQWASLWFWVGTLLAWYSAIFYVGQHMPHLSKMNRRFQ